MPARLIDVRSPRGKDGPPRAIVLVLHGGSSRPDRPAVSPTQLSVLRMIPLARRIALAGSGRLVVARLLNTSRGWDPEQTPVHDALTAIEQSRQRWGALPVGLVGHSLGGRAALMAGSADPVRSVVALNPWVNADDDADLAGRRVLVVHGTDDRIAPIDRSRLVAQRLGRRTSVEFTEVPGGRHAMLRHASRFEEDAATFTCAALLDPDSALG